MQEWGGGFNTATFSNEGDNVANGTATLMENHEGIAPGQANLVTDDYFPPGKADALPNTPWCNEPDPNAEWPDNNWIQSTGYVMNFALLSSTLPSLVGSITSPKTDRTSDPERLH